MGAEGALPCRNSPTRAAEGGFRLAGPSNLPDAAFHAYRRDLADAALAGQVIASHYADPLERRLAFAAPLLAGPDEAAAVLAELQPGDLLEMLDNSRGWAWGYAGPERRVGYVKSAAIGG
ncbi:hypothetical protein ACFQPG_05660 [Sphingomonas sp. GCM10030256]|uniref:hypothetical protein n=1 Tax=Sphingomonas sp. GCM10030256 TaxID=3273427 RepID=UPI00361CE543